MFVSIFFVFYVRSIGDQLFNKKKYATTVRVVRHDGRRSIVIFFLEIIYSNSLVKKEKFLREIKNSAKYLRIFK